MSTTVDFGDTTSTSTSGGLDTTSTSGVDTTDTATASGSSTAADTTSGDTETTGDEVLPGQTMSQLVSAGTSSTSASYRLVYTFGQPSALQSTHESASYRIQGGITGANASPP